MRSVVPRAVLSGVLLGIASLPALTGPVAFVALVPLLSVIDRGAGVCRAAAAGWLAGAAFFGIGFGFVPAASGGGGMPVGIAYVLGVALLATGIGAFAALVALGRVISRGFALAVAPGLWIAHEIARTGEWVVSIPWLHLGYALADTPVLLGAAPVLGVYGISCWIVGVNAAIAGVRRTGWPAPTIAALLLLPVIPGLWSGGAPPNKRDLLRIAVVQPDTPDRDRIDPGRHNEVLRRLLDQSELLAAGADLLVWPESAYPRPVGDAGDPFVAAIAGSLGAPLLTGAWRQAGGSAGLINAGFLAHPGGFVELASEKAHPVSVYERAPEGGLSRALAARGFWRGRFRRGDRLPPVAIRIGDGRPVLVGVLLCIDASYPAEARRLRAEGAEILVQLSNEKQTGVWSARLHARVVRFRAIETRLPVVRVANGGPTQWIDAEGRIRAEIPSGASGSATYAVPVAASAASRCLDESGVLGLAFLPGAVVLAWPLFQRDSACA